MTELEPKQLGLDLKGGEDYVPANGIPGLKVPKS